MRAVEQVKARARQGRLIAVVIVVMVMPMIVVATFGYKDAAAQRASKTNG